MTLLSRIRIAALCALAFASRGVPAAEATYALDPVHTRVMFSVSHAGFSNPMFTIAGTTGTLVFDPDDWSKARVEARIPVNGLELTDTKWKSAILGRNFLDANQYPEATFVSTRIEPIDATHATVVGMLTLRNVSREVKLDVVLHQVKRHPLPPFRRTAGFSATGTISRKVFSITAWGNVVGDAVEIRIEAEGTRSRNAGEPETDETMPAPSSTTPAPASSIEPPPAASTVAPASNATTTP
jgi:polyisoprenoid-binding protein YceI